MAAPGTRKALVTGASGLIGANLIRELIAADYRVRALVRPTSRLDALAGLDVDLVGGDVLKPDALERATAGVDVVFHAAANFAYSGHSPESLEGTAVGGTLNVLRAARRGSVRRVVLTSSSVVFGHADGSRSIDETAGFAADSGLSPYERSKIRQVRAAQQAATELGVDLVTVCPTMSVGPHGTILGPSNAVITSYLSDPFRMTYPGGCNIVSVRDIARGHLLAADAGIAGERYILGSENLDWPAIHEVISELAGAHGPSVRANHTACYVVAALEEGRAWWERRTPATTREQAKMVGHYYWYSHAKAAATFGYSPRPARRALAEAISWLAGSPHISREVRAGLRLNREVYAARRDMASDERQLRKHP